MIERDALNAGTTTASTDDELETGVFYEVAARAQHAAAVGAARARARRRAEIDFCTRKWIRPEDLDANGTLVGGSLLTWIDEEATIYAIVQLGNPAS